jgi:SpoVK/Ycf46/Vps4 family AAA+-type ATPase
LSRNSQESEVFLNAALLKRLIRAIANGSQTDLDLLAEKIIKAQSKIGHTRLAAELESIWKQHKPKQPSVQPSAPVINQTLKKLPASPQYGETLTMLIQHNQLEHYIVLPEAVEQRFVRIETEYAARDRLRKFGLKPRKTVLLYGPPGCGKSLSAKWLAWNTGLPLMKVRFDILISSPFDEAAWNLQLIFNSVRAKPCLLLLEKCDFNIWPRTASQDISDVSHIVNLLLQFVEEYDVIGLLVATTNLESALDTTLLRYFDDVFSIPLPSKVEIEKLLKLTLSSTRIAEFIPWKSLSIKLEGASASMVIKAAKNAVKTAVLAGRHPVTQGNLLDAIEDLHLHNTPRRI